MSRENTPKEGAEFEFDCPECGTHIVGEVSQCPHCGVEFIIEEVEGLRCPECGEEVPEDATECPHCGVEFEIVIPQESPEEPEGDAESEETASDEPAPEGPAPEGPAPERPFQGPGLREQFPGLVEEVRPMLDLAQEYGVRVPQARALLEKAARAGKRGDLSDAVGSIKECRSMITSVLRERTESDLERLEQMAEIARQKGEDPGSVETALREVRDLLARGEIPDALRRGKEGMKEAELVAGKYLEASQMVERLEWIVANAERFYIDTSPAREHLEQAREAEENRDWSMMGMMAKKGREEMMSVLPGAIQEELRKAKSTLLDAKAEGKEVSVLVRLLKEAGKEFKRKEYENALDKLVEFKSEARHL
ncbi:MAG: zinc ribbon domain-containing protein [Methanomassiliicoccales archaeon]